MQAPQPGGTARMMRIVCPSDWTPSVSQSTGVERLDGRTAASAWTSSAPWVQLETCILARDRAQDWPVDLNILKLPDALLAHAHGMLIPMLTRTSGRGDAELAQAIAGFREDFLKALALEGYRMDSAGPADLIVHQPGRRSTAYDYGADELIGLHIDNHQNLPLGGRARALVLANINIGWRERYLDVVPRDVESLCRSIDADPSGDLLPREIKTRFLSSHPLTPVLRVTLPPGVAYLLNTQNYIHDGATPDGDVPDICFLTMGNRQ